MFLVDNNKNFVREIIKCDLIVVIEFCIYFHNQYDKKCLMRNFGAGMLDVFVVYKIVCKIMDIRFKISHRS